MTTNYQRALDLADHIAAVDESPRELVKQLSDAGLLALDLPKPIIDNGDVIWELDGYFDDVMTLDEMVCVGVNTTYGVALDLDEAEALALALLAAVKRQKEQA